ncbi:ABC transporter permease [Catenulispora pinisilvae]|uniref:ABC transporter permease n=1 Tax=Catenulispora pinisilvae TaxID=2705253 RepID=UPI0018915FB0|nr:ABC transporter permease [Catenulispora pinisilvae]
MNFLKRAWWRLRAHVIKTLMLTGLFFVVCTLVLSGFLIQSAAARAADGAKKSVGAVVTMQLDLNALMNSGKGGTPANGQSPGLIGPNGDLHIDLVDKICKSPVVVQCNYTTQGGAAPSSDIKLYQPPGAQSSGGVGVDFFQGDGVRDLNAVQDFRNGDSKLIAGTGIGPDSPADGVVIEKRLADANHLKVGAKVHFKIGELDPALDHTKEFPYTVVGIYSSDKASATGQNVPAMLDPGNQLYFTAAGASTLLGKTGDGVVNQATFTLADPADLGRLKADATAAGADLSIFPLSINDKEYQTLVGPITKTAGFATVTVWLVSIGGTVILGLIVAFSLRERRKEMGVLLSMGEKKPRLLGQHLVEVFACAVLAIAGATAISTVLSRSVGNHMLAGEVSSAENAPKDNTPDHSNVLGASSSGSGSDTPTVTPISKLDVRVGSSDIARIGAAGLGIAAAATLIPGIAVLRLNPREILTKGD